MANTMKRIRQDSTGLNTYKKSKNSVELRVSLEDNVQYVNKYFPVTVLLLNSDGQLHTKDSNKIKILKPKLCYKDNHSEFCDSILELEDDIWNEKEDGINLENGRLTFQAKINTLSRDQAGRDFVIFIDTLDNNIGPCYSLPISIVSYKLSILSNIPNKFYNQMGGGGNCILLEIEARDDQNHLVKNMNIPLEILLMYSDDGEQVRTQDILTKSDDSQMMIDNKGKAIMKVRIEHVSRKHQNRQFCIKVKSNLLIDPLSANVAPVLSTPINVLSKITPRDKRTNIDINKRGSRSSISQSSSFDNTQENDSNSNSFQSYMLPQSQGNMVQNVISQNATTTTTQMIISDQEDDIGGGSAVDRIPPSNTPLPIADALSNVLGWIDTTLKCLCDSKWQQVGFEQSSSSGDLVNDQSKPLYAMSNPNDRIQLQLDAYRTKVMGSLQTVLEGIEPLLEISQNNESSSSSSSSSINQGGGSAATNEEDKLFHPEPLSHVNDESNMIRLQPTELSRSGGSSGIIGSAEFDSLVSGAVGDLSSDPMLPLLRGLSRGFSDFGNGV